MAAVGLLPAGGRVTAAMLRSVAPLATYKVSSQSVTSSTALINDSVLFVPAAINAVYYFELFVSYAGFTQGASDLKVGFTAPSGASMAWEPTYLNTSGVLISGISNLLGAVISAGTNGSSNIRVVKGSGTFAMGGSVGNLQLQWAQNTSNSTPTTVQAGSLLALWQVQ